MQSSTQRSTIINHLQQDEFDVVIIGGGITGAGIALDAAARGMRTALVEKYDFASGTSSRSTKLIHGGLRYLKQLEIGLVREVGTERAVVHRLAPHLVRPEKMLLPLVEGGTYGKVATSMGLWVYDVLAGVTGEDKRRMLSREETLACEPLLRADVVVGGGFYAEYRTDDARLTIENIKTAIREGALCLNYCEARGFEYHDNGGRIRMVRCHDHHGDQTFTIRTRGVISAAGPWVDELRERDQSLQGKRLFLSKGVHIVVPFTRFPLRQAIYFDVPDGRMIFAIPRGRATYIGTTDTPYSGDPHEVRADLSDVDYLLQAANSMFPTIHLRLEDVESSWAGLRPLIFEEGKTGAEMSRRDEIFESPSGLLSIAGGKLTGYRKMAERVVDRLAERLDGSFPESRTAAITLAGGPFADDAAVTRYEAALSERLLTLDLPPKRAGYLVSNYGRQSDAILDLVTENGDRDGEQRLAAAEADFTIELELALYPLDFYNRRSGRLYFDLPSIAPSLDTVLEQFARRLNYTTETRQQQREQVEKAIFEAADF